MTDKVKELIETMDKNIDEACVELDLVMHELSKVTMYLDEAVGDEVESISRHVEKIRESLNELI